MTDIEQDIEYTFELSEITNQDYRMAYSISEWLKRNLESIKDSKDNILFGKVNTGFNEDTLKGFGKKPVCDVYVGNVEYNNDFENSIPESVHSIIIFYLKGANNNAYMKCNELHDFLIQEFITNESFRYLDSIVKDTRIINSELMNQPLNKKWGVMGALELSHILY